jgi:hypothetical protein
MKRKEKALKSARFLVVGFFVAFLSSVLIGCERRSAKVSRCLYNLHYIQLGKELWAENEEKTKNDVPSWDDLRPFFPASWSNSIPICPAGGNYRIGSIGEKPTCSIGGQRHSLQ